MPIRHPGIILVSLIMAIHAVMIGRYLESVFFLMAFCWAWMGVTAFRDRLQLAQSMALIMVAILLLAALPLAVLNLDRASLTPYLSLALIPGVISWACMYFYIRHITVKRHDDQDADRDDAAYAWDGAVAAADVPHDDASPVQAVSEPRVPDNAPPEELSVARVKDIVAALRRRSAA